MMGAATFLGNIGESVEHERDSVCVYLFRRFLDPTTAATLGLSVGVA